MAAAAFFFLAAAAAFFFLATAAAFFFLAAAAAFFFLAAAAFFFFSAAVGPAGFAILYEPLCTWCTAMTPFARAALMARLRRGRLKSTFL